MNERANPFATALKEMPAFGLKSKAEAPVAKDDVDRIADATGFVSRQPAKTTKPPKEPRREARTYRTGRNVQFNAKVTAETNKRFYKLADERKLVLGELLEQGLDALEALKHLQTLADRRKMTLTALVSEMVAAGD
jgi:hypothetical protein